MKIRTGLATVGAAACIIGSALASAAPAGATQAAPAKPASTPPSTQASFPLTASNGDSVCCAVATGFWGYAGGFAKMNVAHLDNSTGRTLQIVVNRFYFANGSYVRLNGGTVNNGQEFVQPGYPSDGTYVPPVIKWSISAADINRPGLGGGVTVASGTGT